MTAELPSLDPAVIAATRDSLHAYARVLGNWLKSSRARRKHWWHASLRPSLSGLTTGIVHAGGFELELDFDRSVLHGRSVSADHMEIALQGQPADMVAAEVEAFLLQIGCERSQVPRVDHESRRYDRYRADVARDLGRAIRFVAAALEKFRAGIREETSPIQVWPHHFDLSLLWLPGAKVVGADPDDEEAADRQMNFGFVFGDDSVPEPYFYVTAYPLPDAFPELPLPAGTVWNAEGFDGALLTYRTLREMRDPASYLLELWQSLLTAGRELLVTGR